MVMLPSILRHKETCPILLESMQETQAQLPPGHRVEVVCVCIIRSDLECGQLEDDSPETRNGVCGGVFVQRTYYNHFRRSQERGPRVEKEESDAERIVGEEEHSTARI